MISRGHALDRSPRALLLAAFALSTVACGGEPLLPLAMQDCEIVVEVLPRTTHACTQYRGARQDFAPDSTPEEALTIIDEPAALAEQLAQFGFAAPAIDFSSHVALLVWQADVPSDAHLTKLRLTRLRGDGTHGKDPEWIFTVVGTQRVSAAGRLEPVEPAVFVSVVPLPRDVDRRRTQE